jgi:hypothetical protein
MCKGLSALGVAAALLAGCGGSTKTVTQTTAGPGTTTVSTVTTTAAPAPVALDAAQNATVTKAVEFALARCNVGTPGVSDAQIATALTGVVGVYKKLGPNATLAAGGKLGVAVQLMTKDLSCVPTLVSILTAGTR